MKFTSASVATLFMLGVASASPTGQFRSVLPLSPLERRGIDCHQDEDHHKCVCDACEDMETFQVGTRKFSAIRYESRDSAGAEDWCLSLRCARRCLLYADHAGKINGFACFGVRVV